MKGKRKKKRILGRKISNEQWVQFKPYQVITSYDNYYINKAVQVYKILRTHKPWLDQYELTSDDLGTLACILTAHFEDFINEIGIWAFFQQTNKKLYGYSLPFYDLSDYEEDYLNPADFSYLIWHFLCKTTNRIFAPDSTPILQMGESIYELFEPLIEDAPATHLYDKLLTIDETTHFYDLKETLKWFALGSYTMGNEFAQHMVEALNDFMLREDGMNKAMSVDAYSYAIQDDYLYARHSSFSGLSCLEWFAGIANCSKALKQNILDLRQRIMSPLYFEDQVEDYWLFRQLQTNEVLNVRKESVNLQKEMQVEGYMQMMNLVNWKGDWWMSGTTMGYGQISEKEKDKMRKDIASTPFYAYSVENQQNLREATDEMEKYFVEYFGSHVVFFENQKALQAAMEGQQRFHNKKKAIERGEKLSTTDLKKHKAQNIWKDLNYEHIEGLGLIFIPGRGTIIDADIVNLMNIMKAPSVDRKGEKFLFNCLVGEDTTEFVTNYLLDNYPTHNFKFPVAASKVDVLRERHFLQRFLNPQAFKAPIPNTRHTVREE